MDKACSRVEAERPKLVFLCNPNNPTGWFFDEKEMRRLADACAPGLLVIDEAYRPFLEGKRWGPAPGSNVVLLRSMTKAYAIPGLRLGYLLGSA
ncbi:MAG: aminotransferase class I/II-fold pyridoxal phosphate-dependent enzyme, partial [Anaerolineae bacterium]|nr:aminotransferase class I/II-fold pyridoxal phosphate-dependent enzyme [Anaerolineae bacterium]